MWSTRLSTLLLLTSLAVTAVFLVATAVFAFLWRRSVRNSQIWRRRVLDRSRRVVVVVGLGATVKDFETAARALQEFETGAAMVEQSTRRHP